MQKMDEQTRSFLEKDNASDEPEMEQIPIEEGRKLAEQWVVPSSIQLESISDIKISTADAEIPLRIYVPKVTKPLPVYITFHGGGWVYGSLNTHDPFCREIAEQAGVIVVSVDYRLAPEHKYPAALNDCYGAVNWVKTHIHARGGDPNRLGIGGVSAGGNLAAAVVLKAKEELYPNFQAQVLNVPVLQYNFDTPSYQKYAEGYFLTKKLMMWFWDQYLDKKTDGQVPMASPLNAPDLSGLPPTLLVLAEFDPLYDEGFAYGGKLKAANVPVTMLSYPTIHGFTGLSHHLDLGKKATSDMAEFLKTNL